MRKISVLSSLRQEAKAEFIKNAKELFTTTFSIVKKFPNSYRYAFTNPLITMADDIFCLCIKGNSVYMHKQMRDSDFELRRNYFLKALCTVKALEAKISLCYDTLVQGENIFRGREDRTKKFMKWGKLCQSLKNRLQNLMKSDEKRFKEYKG